jgi:hypothetical protein
MIPLGGKATPVEANVIALLMLVRIKLAGWPCRHGRT